MIGTRPRTVAILQARLSSSRLPGKVLLPLAGRSMIGFMIERIRHSRSIDELVLATSIEASDDDLANAVEALGVRVVRGPLDDVLARFALAAEQTSPEIVVRLTGDCPLIDASLIDQVVEKVAFGGALYASNCVPASYPDGLDCEAFRVELLNEAVTQASLPSQREHVTPWIRERAGEQAGAVVSTFNLSDLRWTVDYEDDLVFVRRMVDILGERATEADLFDMLRAYDKLGGRNARHLRNEGYSNSLAND